MTNFFDQMVLLKPGIDYNSFEYFICDVYSSELKFGTYVLRCRLCFQNIYSVVLTVPEIFAKNFTILVASIELKSGRYEYVYEGRHSF